MPSIPNYLHIAKQVFTWYKALAKEDRVNGELLPDNVEDIADSLKVILNAAFFENNSKPTLGDIFDQVQKFQKALSPGVGLFSEDGFIGKRTINLMRRAGTCSGQMRWKPSTTAVANPDDLTDRRIIRWWIDDSWHRSPPKLVGGKDPLVVFEDAIFSWISKVKINCLKASHPSRANLLIKQANIDGIAGGVVADAHVGPPGQMVQELRLDVSESPWSEQKFAFTVAHEFGHVLGLDHVIGAGRLMSSTYQDGLSGPTSGDLELVKRIGWELRA